MIQVCITVDKQLRPGSDAALFISRTYYIELSSLKVGRMNQLECLFQFRTAQPFFSPSPAGNFAFGVSLEQL